MGEGGGGSCGRGGERRTSALTVLGKRLPEGFGADDVDVLFLGGAADGICCAGVLLEGVDCEGGGPVLWRVWGWSEHGWRIGFCCVHESRGECFGINSCHHGD